MEPLSRITHGPVAHVAKKRVIAAIRLLPESRAPKATRLDVPGALLSALALLLLILPLTEGRERGWPWWLIAMLVARMAGCVFAVMVSSASGPSRMSALSFSPSASSTRF